MRKTGTSPRRPWLAAVLSLAQPGLGHLYAGRPGLAVLPPLLGLLLFACIYLGAMYAPVVPYNVVVPLVLLVVVWIGVPVHAAVLARRAGDGYLLRPYNRWYVYAGFFLVMGMLVTPSVLEFARGRFVEAFRIPSGAMAPTMQIGDFLYVVKWPAAERRPARERIMVFEAVEEPDLKVVKRALGMPGDTLSMVAGTLVRNGRAPDEPYAVHLDRSRSEEPLQRRKMKEWQSRYLVTRDPDYAPDLQHWGPLVVPPDSFFALGDNRDSSYDSRYYGFIPFTNVIGRPAVVYFSLETEAPGPFLNRVRWSRIGQRLE
jgi:signal peptidase I